MNEYAEATGTVVMTVPSEPVTVDIVPEEWETMKRQVAEMHAMMSAVAPILASLPEAMEQFASSPIAKMLGVKFG